MWKNLKGGDGGITRTSKKFRSGRKNGESSVVYFILSPEWKTAVTEKEKAYLLVFGIIYVIGLILFSNCMVFDTIMVHTLRLRVYENKEAERPMLQQLQLQAKVTD